MFFLIIITSLSFLSLLQASVRRKAPARAAVRISRTPMNNRGFTIIECMVVIMMIGILTSVCYPTMKDWKETNKINTSAMDIKSILEMAKSQAIKNQKPVAVSFSNAGSYKAFVDEGNEADKFDSDDELYKAGNVKKDVTLFDAKFAATETNTVVFNPLGLATDFSGDLKLRNKKGDIFKRILVSSSGTIRIESSTTGNDGTWFD